MGEIMARRKSMKPRDRIVFEMKAVQDFPPATAYMEKQEIFVVTKNTDREVVAADFDEVQTEPLCLTKKSAAGSEDNAPPPPPPLADPGRPSHGLVLLPREIRLRRNQEQHHRSQRSRRPPTPAKCLLLRCSFPASTTTTISHDHNQRRRRRCDTATKAWPSGLSHF